MAGITSIIVNLGNNITLDESNNYTKTNCRVQLAHNLPEGAEGVCEIKSGNTLLTSFNYKSPGFIFIGTQKQFIPIQKLFTLTADMLTSVLTSSTHAVPLVASSMGVSSSSITVTVNETPTISSWSTQSNLSTDNTVYISGVTTQTFSATPTTKYGATISAVKFKKPDNTWASATKSGSVWSASVSNTTDGNFTAAIDVTTSWGNTLVTDLGDYSVQPHDNPTVSTEIYRCDSNGDLDLAGGYLSVTAWASSNPSALGISSLKLNITGVVSNQSITSGTRVIVGSGSIDPDTAYSGSIVATDNASTYGGTNKTTTYSLSVPTVVRAINVKDGGTGVAFGKLSTTDNLVDSAWKIKAPYMEVGGTDVPFFPKFIVNSSGKTITFSNGYRGIMFVTDSTTANCGVYIIATTGAGTVMRSDIKAASDLTFSTGTGTLTMTVTSGTRNVLMINVIGTVTQ